MEGPSSTATWPVLHGSLESCISLESSLSPLDPTITVSSPLLLQRPSPDAPDFTPCDITVVFPTKHEIRQIYVRSTARIYEIYYAPNSGSANEYLCTVRCSPVQQDANDNEAGGTSSRSSNTSASDDSWVDVTRSFDSNSSKINVSPPRTKEDLYEATAEISDADPCISLTIRLLSIQSTGYVCVDEIYVYGDPVDDDTEEQKNPGGSAAGSSLMALLAPTLLQLRLSKSGIGSTKNNSDSKQPEDPCSHGIGSQVANLIDTTHENIITESRPSVSSQQVKAGSTPVTATEPNKSHVPSRVPDEEVNHNVTTNDHPSRIEKALNELISRVIKIEDTCSRFEENLLKPLCSIEERLSHVETQLSVIAKNSQNSKRSSGTRFSAPDWSCIESDSNSSDVDESNPICGTANALDSPVSLPPELPGNESPASVGSIELPPSLSSTAFQYATQDAEDTNPQIPIHENSSEQPKKSVSIDDALASALAAFMSAGHPQTLNKGFSIKAPEYTTSEESENNDVCSSVSHCAETTIPFLHEDETEVTQCKGTSSSISNNAVHEVPDAVENDPYSDQVEQHNECSSYGKPEGISQFMNDEGPQVDEHNESCSSEKSEGVVQYVNEEEAHGSHNFVSNDDLANKEYACEENTRSNESVYLRMEHEVACDYKKARSVKEATNQEALLQVTELARVTPPVNFDTSLLDVMFVSGKAASTSSSLEALLTYSTAGYEVEVPNDADGTSTSTDDVTTEHDFISVGKKTSILEATDYTVNMHNFDLETTSSVIEDKSTDSETVKGLDSNLCHEVFPASLI